MRRGRRGGGGGGEEEQAHCQYLGLLQLTPPPFSLLKSTRDQLQEVERTGQCFGTRLNSSRELTRGGCVSNLIGHCLKDLHGSLFVERFILLWTKDLGKVPVDMMC